MKPSLEKKFIQICHNVSILYPQLEVFAVNNSDKLAPSEIGEISSFAASLKYYDQFGGDITRIIALGVTRVLDASRTVEEGKKNK